MKKSILLCALSIVCIEPLNIIAKHRIHHKIHVNSYVSHATYVNSLYPDDASDYYQNITKKALEKSKLDPQHIYIKKMPPNDTNKAFPAYCTKVATKSVIVFNESLLNTTPDWFKIKTVYHEIAHILCKHIESDHQMLPPGLPLNLIPSSINKDTILHKFQEMEAEIVAYNSLMDHSLEHIARQHLYSFKYCNKKNLHEDDGIHPTFYECFVYLQKFAEQKAKGANPSPAHYALAYISDKYLKKILV